MKALNSVVPVQEFPDGGKKSNDPYQKAVQQSVKGAPTFDSGFDPPAGSSGRRYT